MRGLGIIVLIVIFFWLIWPAISRWLKRKAMEKAEDYMRSSMGMPPRDKKRKKSQGDQAESSQYSYDNGRQRRNPFGQRRHVNEPIIPKEYAEDVEFTEMKDYSGKDIKIESPEKSETFHESQISDAEWTEIKKPRSK